MRRTGIWATILLLWPLLLPAQVDSLKNSRSGLPLLNGHYFIPNSNFPSPFMTTFFETGVGGGSSLTTIPLSLLEGQLEGNIYAENSYITANVQVQIKVKNWLSTWFKYEANARIGTSTPTILAHGATSISGFEFGWMVSLWRDKKNELSGTISINNSVLSVVNLLQYIQDAVENPDSVTATLSKKNNPLSGGTGLRYVHVFNELWGLQAFLNASYGESLVKHDESVWKFDFGIAASLSLNARYKIPLGMNMGFAVRKFALFESRQEDNARVINYKINYTHLGHYNIGLNFAYLITETPLLPNLKNLEFMTTKFSLVYFF